MTARQACKCACPAALLARPALGMTDPAGGLRPAEPGELTKDAAGEAGQSVALPRPGQPFEPAGAVPVVP